MKNIETLIKELEELGYKYCASDYIYQFFKLDKHIYVYSTKSGEINYIQISKTIRKIVNLYMEKEYEVNAYWTGDKPVNVKYPNKFDFSNATKIAHVEDMVYFL